MSKVIKAGDGRYILSSGRRTKFLVHHGGISLCVHFKKPWLGKKIRFIIEEV